MLEPMGNVQARRLILALSSVRARCFFSLLPDLFYVSLRFDDCFAVRIVRCYVHALADRFLGMSLALLPGTCWMSHAMKATLTHDHH